MQEFFKEYLKPDNKSRQQLLYVMNPVKFMQCEFLINYHEKVRGDKVCRQHLPLHRPSSPRAAAPATLQSRGTPSPACACQPLLCRELHGTLPCIPATLRCSALPCAGLLAPHAASPTTPPPR